MPRSIALVLLISACAPEVGPRGVGGRVGQTGTVTTNPVTGSGWTTTDPETLDCTLDLSEPVVITEYPIATEEDFAFDGSGRMLYQSGAAIVASGPAGAVMALAAGPADPSGLAMLSANELVVAAPDTGALLVVDLATGGSDVLVGGLDQPNGVETGWDGLVYVTERVAGRVIWVDASTGATGVIADGLNRPNGLALNGVEDQLYVAAEDGVYAIKRPEDGWMRPAAAKRVYAFEQNVFVGTVEVDRCGFLYTIDYGSGQLRKIDPETGDALLLADLSAGASFGFGALEFGNGAGWSRSELFTSNRRVVTGIDVGVPGVLSPAAE